MRSFHEYLGASERSMSVGECRGKKMVVEMQMIEVAGTHVLSRKGDVNCYAGNR